MKQDNSPANSNDEVATITINGPEHSYKVSKGSHTVVELKNLGNVPLADELEQIVNRKLVPLADNASVSIQGGEQFVSHPRDSGSSSIR